MWEAGSSPCFVPANTPPLTMVQVPLPGEALEMTSTSRGCRLAAMAALSPAAPLPMINRSQDTYSKITDSSCLNKAIIEILGNGDHIPVGPSCLIAAKLDLFFMRGIAVVIRQLSVCVTIFRKADAIGYMKISLLATEAKLLLRVHHP